MRRVCRLRFSRQRRRQQRFFSSSLLTSQHRAKKKRRNLIVRQFSAKPPPWAENIDFGPNAPEIRWFNGGGMGGPGRPGSPGGMSGSPGCGGSSSESCGSGAERADSQKSQAGCGHTSGQSSNSSSSDSSRSKSSFDRNHSEEAPKEDNYGYDSFEKLRQGDYIECPTLPCYLSKFDALESFSEWAKKQYLAPKKFRNEPKCFVHYCSRFYVPFWHFDATARSSYKGKYDSKLSQTPGQKTQVNQMPRYMDHVGGTPQFMNDKIDENTAKAMRGDPKVSAKVPEQKVTTETWRSKESSCLYSSSLPEMQIAAVKTTDDIRESQMDEKFDFIDKLLFERKVTKNDKSKKKSKKSKKKNKNDSDVNEMILLSNAEVKFLSKPLGETQFQRTIHDLNGVDIMDITLNEKDATVLVLDRLRQKEYDRLTKITKDEKLIDSEMHTHISHQVRLCYMPCFIIHYSINQPSHDGDTFDKQHLYHSDDLITSNDKLKNIKGLRKAMVNGCCGSVSGQRVMSLPKVSLYWSYFLAVPILPLSLVWSIPIYQGLATCYASGLLCSALMLRLSSKKRSLILGDQLNTSQARHRREQILDRDVEQMVASADAAWTSYTSRKQAVIGERDKRREDTYRRFYGMDGGNYQGPDGYHDRTKHFEFDYEAFDFEKLNEEHMNNEGGGRNQGGSNYKDKKQQNSGDNQDKNKNSKVVRNRMLYDELNVSPDASQDEIHASFAELAKQLHPDVLEREQQSMRQEDREQADAKHKESTEKFMRVLSAFQVLKDPQRRTEYDQTGKVPKVKKKKSSEVTTKAGTTSESGARKPHTSGTKRSEFNKGV